MSDGYRYYKKVFSTSRINAFTRSKFEKVGIPSLHEKYHVAWAPPGVVGVCNRIDWNRRVVYLHSPKTKIEWMNPVKFDDLYHLRNWSI